jgi:hypothetical protein
MKRSIAGTCVAVMLAAAALPAAARTEVDFFVNVAPPPLRYEVVPAPRVGYVWVPGYWDWRYKKYYWVRGSWQHHRPGYVYSPVRWEYRGGHYYRHAAGWRDSDHDGVPNRYDRAPRNPTRF